MDFVLATADGRVRSRRDLVADGPALLVLAERTCPTSRLCVDAVARSGARAAIVSQGRIEAALDLAAATGAEPEFVLVDPSPYRLSSDLDVETVPTTLLLGPDGGEVGRIVGWDAGLIGEAVATAGGTLPAGLPTSRPGCASRTALGPDLLEEAEADDLALRGGGDLEEMWRRGWSDGLPVVPPTPDRVGAMLAGRDGSLLLGEVPPAMGELTFERLAACAVLAGCTPAVFPVVAAAASALLDPAYNLHGVQNTTHFASPVVVVNGPVRGRVGLNAGAGALGPGTRANLTIGRALRLLMMLTGGARPGVLDQSTLGGPHKLALCFAENEEASPFEPLHVSLGFDPDDSVVTVLTGESPAGVSDHLSQTVEGLAASLARALERVWNVAWTPVTAETLLVLCPEHARTFGDAGWTRQSLRRRLFEATIRTAGELRATGSGELEPDARDGPDDLRLAKFASEDLITIVVAGGEAGRFSAVVAPWLVTGPGSRMVSRRVEEG